MTKMIEVKQDTLLATVANFHKFVVVGLYDDGMILKAPSTKKEKETESDRMSLLKCSLLSLRIDCYIRKNPTDNTITVQLN